MSGDDRTVCVFVQNLSVRMTLVGAILKQVHSKNSVRKKLSSPPPEVEHCPVKRTRKPHKYAQVGAVVDSSPPRYDPARLPRHLPEWRRRTLELYRENIKLLAAIRKTHFDRGRVDSRWEKRPQRSLEYYRRRVDFCKQVQAQNRFIYKRIVATGPRVEPTVNLRRDWAKNRKEIIYRAQNKFVLFPPVPIEAMEDPIFKPPPGVKRPRVYLSLRIRNCAMMGELCVELFTDVCPSTCQLFLELLEGDGLGHCYVGTCFYRKVPGLYWSGGDVICNNGFGCYAQRGRRVPIGAENYHFSHSMHGLLSMRVTQDDEMCGVFNITFKPLPQFDLHSVVFGRIIRPSHTYNSMVTTGSALSSQPVVELAAARVPSRPRRNIV